MVRWRQLECAAQGTKEQGMHKERRKRREIEIQNCHTLEIVAKYQFEHCGGQARTTARERKFNREPKPNISQNLNGVRNNLGSHHSENLIE